MSLPILYSFRRCPYAMRARLALIFAEQKVELREIVLKNKPVAMLALSPKGTVPVLQLSAGQLRHGQSVLEESRDIMQWALEQYDPKGLLQVQPDSSQKLMDENDQSFKYWLDRYKYADRYPEQSQAYYREQGELFLQQLESLLSKQPYLLGANISLADIGIMPFVRQFAHVDRQWFNAAPYPRLQSWLNQWLESREFKKVMTSYQSWQEDEKGQVFCL
ncbi:glutathione S-transferase [Oceanospirillum multiglobuliferum]|uniref:Glutathione S-transferase n=1 Tax=Oceanospirillum multiglobuliferum TaxID=64969 RepID=A0A1T4S4W6_9GAMM|nr:glutathione S-transferase [Oceanospirillum multiglobuliferum]OPX54442.1 glutathione S-transferase [Oceanospirillum multiglobuliferum]SKA23275.1 glutathione S-transferase [Oceanospirillum multiglobuliferum]